MERDEDAGRWLDVVKTSSVEAEWSVVGSMLIDDKTIPGVMGELQPDDFADPTTRNTFTAIRAMFLAGRPVDPVLVMKELNGGEQWVSWARQVMDLTPTTANVGAYVSAVKEQSTRRRVAGAAYDLYTAAGTAELDEVTRRAMELPGLLSSVSRGRTVTAAELMEDAFKRATSKVKREYLPWGIPTANDAMYIEPGDLVLLGGYPSAGKTLLSVQMAIAQARSRRVVYYTLETQPAKMADRILAHISPVSLTAVKKREVPAEDIPKMATATARFVQETPITFVHASHFTVDDIAADALAKRAQVVFIDYVQLVEGEGRTDYARVSKVSRDLKMFAQSNSVAVVALAQLARAEKVTQKGVTKKMPPDMSSLKESGQLEQDADAVFLLWKLNEDDNNSERVLKLGKNKEGKRFSTVLKFDGPTQTMTDLQVSPSEYKSGSIAAQLAADGRAIKRANSAAARMEQMEQTQFEELPEDGDELPF